MCPRNFAALYVAYQSLEDEKRCDQSSEAKKMCCGKVFRKHASVYVFLNIVNSHLGELTVYIWHKMHLSHMCLSGHCDMHTRRNISVLNIHTYAHNAPAYSALGAKCFSECSRRRCVRRAKARSISRTSPRKSTPWSTTDTHTARASRIMQIYA